MIVIWLCLTLRLAKATAQQLSSIEFKDEVTQKIYINDQSGNINELTIPSCVLSYMEEAFYQLGQGNSIIIKSVYKETTKVRPSNHPL